MCTPKNSLNRSCSESDLYNVNFDNLTVQEHSSVNFNIRAPVVRKRILFVEEIIHDNPGLLRSGSCSQVFGQSILDHHNLQRFFSTSSVLNKNVYECDISKLNLNVQINPNPPMVSRNYMNNADGVIPMEVDLLNNSIEVDDCVDPVETMDIDIDPNNVPMGRFNNFRSANADSSVMKKRHLSHEQADVSYSQKSIAHTNNTKIVPITLRKKQSQQSHCLVISLVCLVIILLYILFPKDYNIMVNSDIQLLNIQKELLEKVHQQKASVNIVVQSLEQREHWAHKIKVLGFIGSAGVGKTFVANIIKKHFPQELIHELYGIQFSYKSEWEKLLNTLKNCCCNLIIIDDLNRKDTTEVFALIHSLPQDQFILVISIFNIQYYDGKNYTINYNDVAEIRKEFENSGSYHELVVFQEFNIKEVKDWIKQQLKSKNIDYNIQEEIQKTVLEGYIVKYRGLKGLNSKILLELEKYN